MLEKFLTNLLYDTEPGVSGSKINPKTGDGPALGDGTETPLEQKLIKILAHTSIVNTGRVQLLGLGQIKKKVGEKWPELRHAILNGLEQIVNKRISSEDVFFSKNDEEHIIVFAHLTEDKARLVCAKILQELLSRYLGNVDTKDIIVRTATGVINGELKFKASSLEELLTSVSMTDVTGSTVPLSSYEGDKTSNLRSPENLARFFQESKNRLNKIIEPVFMPLWDSRHQVVSNYGLNYRLRGKVSPIGNYGSLLRNFKIRDKVIAEYILVEECENILTEFHANKFRAVFCLPVSYETVYNPDLVLAYTKNLAGIPEELRRYVSITLMEFPAGIPEGKIRFITSSLKRYCSNIILHCQDFIPQDIVFYKECGISCISLTLSNSKRGKADYWNSLATTVEKCHKNAIKTTVINLQSPDELMLAHEAGFDFLAGEALCKNTVTPGHMVRITWKELLAGKSPSF